MFELNSLNIYVGLAISGFFTGLGVVVANFFFDYWIKPRIKRIHKKLNGRRG